MITVVKRNGQKEELNLDKLHKVLENACDGIQDVSVSEIELKSQIQFYSGIKTSDIQETMIKASSELISEENPNYQYVAARLINYQLRKDIYGQYSPPSLFKHYSHVVDLGYYSPDLLEKYTEEDFIKLNNHINHDRDSLLTYVGMEQLRSKYLVKNRVTGELYETPQMAFMLIAMTLFQNYEKGRLKWVKDLYDGLSTFDFSLPTPIMAGVRTNQKQYSSCFLVETGDSLNSINATTSAIVLHVAQKAGVGIGAGRIRAFGSPIRGGDAYHTGVVPFYKHFRSGVKSCSQGGVRSGSATLNALFWHKEIEDILVLKNNKGTEDNRVRDIDYCIQLNKYMLQRIIEGKDLTLFCPNDVPDLYEAFYKDQDKFAELYEKYERAYSIDKKTVSAMELFSSLVQERKDTGRIYIMFVDNMNEHSSFIVEKAPIRMTNLCVEIGLPSTPLNDVNDENGRIALCILAAINWGKIKKPKDFEKPCTLVVRALDALIDIQDYLLPATEKATKEYRPIGVGTLNLAHWLAKNDTNYTDCDLDLLHEYCEAYSYYLIKASADLAEEFGPCELNENTRYSQGILPIDTYKKDVDGIVEPKYNMPWENLRDQLKRTGIRNATTMADMPGETSASISNGTNGVEPPRAVVSVKQSKDGVLKQVIPDIKLKDKYEYLWDQKSPEGYLKIMAVKQKFMDQSISTNTSYNPKFYPDGKIPISALMKDIFMAYKLGLKTLYYNNTHDGSGEIDIDEEDCESCKL